MIEPRYFPYQAKARDLIREGDILLFRGTSVVSKIIQRATQGRYSHVGIASWHYNNDDILELVEFREWKGGRTTAFARQLELYDKQIDVYRVMSPKKVVVYDEKSDKFFEKWVELNPELVTHEMRKMTGLPYGFRRILWMAKFYIIGIRFLFSDSTVFDDSSKIEQVFPVCSTAVSTAFSRNGFDLVHNRSDERTTPVDIARSPLTEYLFTPYKDF